jgi:hypothetical protein
MVDLYASSLQPLVGLEWRMVSCQYTVCALRRCECLLSAVSERGFAKSETCNGVFRKATLNFENGL